MGISLAYGDAFGVALAERGWARGAVDGTGFDGFLEAAPGHQWRPVEGPGYAFEQARVDEAAIAAAMDVKTAIIVRHRPGHHGLPPLGEGAGFVLDFNEDWPSRHGGLLLFRDGSDEDKVAGFRPEQGVMTVFDTARPPLLTLVAPGAADRYAIIGRLA